MSWKVGYAMVIHECTSGKMIITNNLYDILNVSIHTASLSDIIRYVITI